MNRKNNISFIVFSFALILSILQKIPILSEKYYNFIRIILYILIIILIIFRIKYIRKFLYYQYVKLFLITIIYSSVLGLISNIFSIENQELIDLLIPFFIMMLSFGILNNKYQLKQILFEFVIFSTIMAIYVVLYYAKGFIIAESYITKQKNQIGPIIGLALLVSIYLINENEEIYNKIMLYIITLLLLGSTLVIRYRSGIIALLLIFAIYIFNYKIKIKNYIQIPIYSLVILVVLTIYLKYLSNLIYLALFSGFNTEDINSISSGRLEDYYKAILYIINNPLLGKLSRNEYIGYIPHNYIINKILNYGIILSVMHIVLYFYLFYIGKSIWKIKSKNKFFELVLYSIIYCLILSITEYEMPYGPGTSMFMLWILIGYYFKLKREIKFNMISNI